MVIACFFLFICHDFYDLFVIFHARLHTGGQDLDMDVHSLPCMLLQEIKPRISANTTRCPNAGVMLGHRRSITQAMGQCVVFAPVYMSESAAGFHVVDTCTSLFHGPLYYFIIR